MALTLGFVVVFAAGVAIAYFAGVNAARSPNAAPANRAPPPAARQLTSESDLEAAPAMVDPASVHPAGDCDANIAGGQLPPLETAVEESDGYNTRRFPRRSFSGTAQATIYPPKRGFGGKPMQCEVLTRDLCCSGIGIAHTQRLLPEQMIVLEAAGKILVAEVRWCQRMDKDFYVVGCRLIKTNT